MGEMSAVQVGGVRLVTIRAGHLVHAIEPVAFLDEVTAFLGDGA
jgi:pimeloyl-ACP methyl ester carboxylesterase